MDYEEFFKKYGLTLNFGLYSIISDHARKIISQVEKLEKDYANRRTTIIKEWEKHNQDFISKNSKIRSDDPNNRYLIASTKISQGDIIFEVDPITYYPTKTKAQELCHYCLKKVEKPKICSSCKIGSYCDSECQRNDWSDHKLDCEIFKKPDFNVTALKHFNDLTYILFRIVVRTQFPDSPKYNFQYKTQFGQIESMSSLPTKLNQNSILDFINSSFLLFNTLKMEPSYENVELIFKFYSAIEKNVFTIFDSEYQPYAIGLYFPTNFINHNCIPNAVPVYINQKQYIIAIQNIDINSEISINYVDIGMSTFNRRNALTATYSFLCNCERCVKELHTDDYKSWVKSNCCMNGYFNLATKLCTKCSKPISYNVWKEKINCFEKIKRKKDTSKQYEINGNLIEAMKIMEEIRDIEKSFMFEKNYSQQETLESLLFLSLQNKYFVKAQKYCKDLIDLYLSCYPRIMPSVAITQYKYGKILLYNGCTKEGYEVLRNAFKILTITNKPQKDFISELYQIILETENDLNNEVVV